MCLGCRRRFVCQANDIHYGSKRHTYTHSKQQYGGGGIKTYTYHRGALSSVATSSTFGNGASVGEGPGDVEGLSDGLPVGIRDGGAVGKGDGAGVGEVAGLFVDTEDGTVVGAREGAPVGGGTKVGADEGASVLLQAWISAHCIVGQ